VLACVPGVKTFASWSFASSAPSGNAAGDALGERHRVGLDPEVLVREHLARAAHPGLHLVEQQQRAVAACTARAPP